MKKIILLFISILLSTSFCCADELRLDQDAPYQKKLMEIGFRILNANRVDKRMTFYYKNDQDVNAKILSRTKKIYIYKGLIPFIDNDDELAAIIAHEIAHGLDLHEGLARRTAMKLRPIKYEQKADRVAVDLIVNAGYNPLALIIVLNKTTGEPCFASSRSNGTKRLANIYEYIYKKYPAYLVYNDYKKNIYYQNFLLTTKSERAKIRQKYQEEKLKFVSNKEIKRK